MSRGDARLTPAEWKCIKRQEGPPYTVDAWEPGGNNVLNTPPSGSAGITTGAF